jgi:hypothetical protein
MISLSSEQHLPTTAGKPRRGCHLLVRSRADARPTWSDTSGVPQKRSWLIPYTGLYWETAQVPSWQALNSSRPWCTTLFPAMVDSGLLYQRFAVSVPYAHENPKTKGEIYLKIRHYQRINDPLSARWWEAQLSAHEVHCICMLEKHPWV